MKYAFLIFMLFLTTCETKHNDEIICTEIFVYGLNITVKNADTNAIITNGITVIAREGVYEEELINPEGSDSYIGAGERAGSYIVKITSNDYLTYTSEVILVG